MPYLPPRPMPLLFVNDDWMPHSAVNNLTLLFSPLSWADSIHIIPTNSCSGPTLLMLPLPIYLGKYVVVRQKEIESKMTRKHKNNGMTCCAPELTFIRRLCNNASPLTPLRPLHRASAIKPHQSSPQNIDLSRVGLVDVRPPAYRSFGLVPKSARVATKALQPIRKHQRPLL